MPWHPLGVLRRIFGFVFVVGAACGGDGGETGNTPGSGGGGAASGGASGSSGMTVGGMAPRGGSGTGGSSAIGGAGGSNAGGSNAGGSQSAGGSESAGEAGETAAGGSGGENVGGDTSAGGSETAGESAGGNATAGGGAGGDGNTLGPDDVFGASTRFTVVDPLDFGAVGEGSVDDTDAMQAAIDELPPEGGIVLFQEGTYWKERALLRVETDHVLFWAPNRRATIHGTVRTLTEEEIEDDLCGVREQALIFDHTLGGGVYGLRFTSNGVERTSCAEDAHIVLNGVDGVDVVGVEVDGGPTNGVFVWSSQEDDPPSMNVFLEGNYFHHTYADSVHHTRGTRRSWCWRNYMFNEEPSLGDDGLACVTYAVDAPRCGEMEWWDNVYLGGMHGRGLAVVGGDDISIHHNWIIGSASAGLIVASENAYTTSTSNDIELFSNWIVGSPNGSVDNGHSSILISGGNEEAGTLTDIRVIDNVVIDAPDGRVERAEGDYDEESVIFENTSTNPDDLPGPVPTLDDVELEDTSVLRTRDVSFVEENERKGLYRIHVREAAGEGLEERFEYVVSGATDELESFLAGAGADAGVYVSEVRNEGDVSHALVLSPVPLVVPDEIDGIGFEDLRAGDRDGTLTWLWQRIDRGEY